MNPELAKVIADINKKAKRDLIMVGADLRPINRITSGSLCLDAVLGGGWPTNRWAEIIGDPSHGKTAIALKTIAANQEKNPDFVAHWVAAEEYNYDWAERLGVDNDRVIFTHSNIMEDAYDSVLRFAESREVDMAVIDSLAALVPASEDEKGIEEFTVGRGALVTNKFFRKALVASHREPGEREFFGLVINQWRQKIGVMYGDPRTTPGGVGKDYAFSVRVEVKRDEWIEAGTGDHKRPVGQTIRARAIKNKTAPPRLSALFDFYFAEGGACNVGEIDFAKETVAMGMYYGVIERAGAYYRYGGEQWRGTEATLQAIRENVDLKEALEREVLERSRG